ncbi:hypothetical protein QCD61_28355 (plasmid) [Pseudomonas viciae]|uniref:Uncharacterized protein n=1 Tax=Pseudomonas viciae TaxID=2505979 RepID=A0ABY8PME4_9PSED|nr:hypothetical protein [Pseudomonas viciae]WGO96412.1 hypothetical protein QCD61_28355 [Pseudomonas viciae]
MNRLTAGLLLGLIAGVPGGAAIHALYARQEAPESQPAKDSLSFDRSGSPEAAIGLAGEYAKHSFIVIGGPRIWADTAAVPVLIAGRKCEITMQRAKVEAENRTGWRVTNQSCQ